MPYYNEENGVINRKVMSKHANPRDWWIIKINEKGETVITTSIIRFPKKFAGKRVRLRAEFLDYKPRKKGEQNAKS